MRGMMSQNNQLQVLYTWSIDKCPQSGAGRYMCTAEFWVKILKVKLSTILAARVDVCNLHYRSFPETLYFLQFIWDLICYLTARIFSKDATSFSTAVGWTLSARYRKCWSHGPFHPLPCGRPCSIFIFCKTSFTASAKGTSHLHSSKVNHSKDTFVL